MLDVIRAYFSGALTAYKNIQPSTHISDEICYSLALEQTAKCYNYPIDELQQKLSK